MRENWGLGVLNELLGLDVVHAVDTGDTVTVVSSSADCVYSSMAAMAHGCGAAYPTERTRPVSAREFSSWTPRMRCSRMEETSVGVALASEA